MKPTKSDLAPLTALPNVGEKFAGYLWRMGIRQPADIATRSPDENYLLLCKTLGGPQDRCVLYVFRALDYWLTTKNPDTRQAKWWLWKDRK